MSFEIEPASFVSFVGPSGSGKTTLLNLIGCLDKPTEGGLIVAGEDVTTLGRKQGADFRGSTLGFIFQSFNLLPVLTAYENIEKNFFVKDGGILQRDMLADDLALIIDTDFGLVVILGCAHRGIINTLHHAQNLTGKEYVYAAIGGTHLFQAGEEQIEQTIAELKTMGIQRLGVSHCTGFQASARLSQEFRDVFFLNNAGTRFTLP